MISHLAVWDAIDAVARRCGLTPSGLARLAGLDATAFNRSKRVSKDGRERWPSMESVSKILDATGETMDSFISGNTYLQATPSYFRPMVPLLGLAQAGAGGFFDPAGLPSGNGWDAIDVPNMVEPGTYALEISGDSMLPLYRPGDRIIVSPTAQARRGDRVVVRTKDGEVMVKILHRQTAKLLELHSLNAEHLPRIIPMTEVEGIGRIVWASQ